jgi:hypothetical protein
MIKFWKKNKLRVIYLIIYSFLVSISFFGERITLNNGLGYDGSTRFAPAVRTYKEKILDRTIDSYYLQRLIPSILVDAICKSLDLDVSEDKNIVNGFEILNLISLLTSIFIFLKISIYFQISPILEFLFFIFLFFNLPNLKILFTNPVTTDGLAFCLGMFSVYGLFCKKKYILFLSLLFGSFTFPSFFYIGLIVLVFWNIDNIPSYFLKKRLFSKLVLLSPLIGTIGIAFSLGLLLMWKGQWISMFYSLKYQLPNKVLILPSIILAIVYLYYILKVLVIKYKFDFLNFKKSETLIPLKFFFLNFIYTLLTFTAFTYLLSFYRPAKLTLESYFATLAFFPIVNPLIFLVNHLIYYGPVIFLLIIFYKKAAHLISKLGLTYVFIFIIFSVMALNSESRRYINVFPFFAIVVMLSVRKLNFNFNDILFFGISSLIMSRIWYQFFIDGTFNPSNEILEFPMQRFMMASGPWTSTFSYFIHLSFCIILFYFIFRRILIIKNREELVYD